MHFPEQSNFICTLHQIMSTDISVIELKKRLDNQESLNILDVREQYEFDEFNLNGTLIPLGELPGRLDEIEHLKDEEIIVHCRSGARSNTAKMFLSTQGYSNVRNLIGGVMDWKSQFGD
jgi:rhodanese-related sulfurtransferase